MNSIPSRASRTQEYDLEEDETYYTQRPHSSAVRYTQPRQQVIQRGNKRIVIHNEPPPRRNLHWSFILGLGMLTMLGLWVMGSYALSCMHVTGVTIVGKNLLIYVWFVARPTRIWLK